jgi:lysozyme
MGTSGATRRGFLSSILIVTLSMSSAALAARDLGVDVSHFQGETGMGQNNWDQLAAEGRTFAFAKATEGLSPPGNIDFTWPTNVQRAQTAGLLAGVYHFARPDNRPNVIGARAEADHFVATAGAAMNAGNLRPVLDLERAAATQTAADLTDWVLAFVDEVVLLKGAGAEPIVYCDTFFASSKLDSRVAGLDLWIRSINGQNPQTGQPSTTGQFSDWAFWQYQVGPAGGLSAIDLNVQHSEAQPLSAFLVVVPEPTSASAALLIAFAVTARRKSRGR